MTTLDFLKASARRGGPAASEIGTVRHDAVESFFMSDEEERRLVAQHDVDDAHRAAYAKEALRRLANQVTNVAEKRAEIVREPLASGPQTRFFASLCDRLARSGIQEFTEIAWTANEWHANLLGKHGGIPKRLVSDAIDRLKTHVARMEAAKPARPVAPAPKKPAPVDVEDGRYALRGEDGVVRFYRVKHAKSSGRVYAMIQAGSELHPVRRYEGGRQVVERIAEDPEAAQVLYGRELGECYHCGRDLTDELSRSLGIGPVCRSK